MQSNSIIDWWWWWWWCDEDGITQRRFTSWCVVYEQAAAQYMVKCRFPLLCSAEWSTVSPHSIAASCLSDVGVGTSSKKLLRFLIAYIALFYKHSASRIPYLGFYVGNIRSYFHHRTTSIAQFYHEWMQLWTRGWSWNAVFAEWGRKLTTPCIIHANAVGQLDLFIKIVWKLG